MKVSLRWGFWPLSSISIALSNRKLVVMLDGCDMMRVAASGQH